MNYLPTYHRCRWVTGSTVNARSSWWWPGLLLWPRRRGPLPVLSSAGRADTVALRGRRVQRNMGTGKRAQSVAYRRVKAASSAVVARRGSPRAIRGGMGGGGVDEVEGAERKRHAQCCAAPASARAVLCCAVLQTLESGCQAPGRLSIVYFLRRPPRLWPPILSSFGCWPHLSLAYMVHDAQTASERASARPALVAVPLFQGLLGPLVQILLAPPTTSASYPALRTAAASQRRVPFHRKPIAHPPGSFAPAPHPPGSI